MKHKYLKLIEYSYLFVGDSDSDGDRAITTKQFEELENFVLKNETCQYLKIAHKKGRGKVLQAQNFVGVIQTKDGTIIEILPKIADLHGDANEGKEEKAKKILLKMLRTLKDSPFKNVSMANLKSAKLPLLEVFIFMFLESLAELVRRGIKSDYIACEENLAFLKGKLKMGVHIRQNYIHKERFFVQYDDYLADRVENRLIKTTLEYLYKKSKLSSNQQRIREFLFVFDDISYSQDPETDFSKVRLNRQMKDYEKVLLWCRTFLLGNSFSPYKGNDVAFALLFDMNLLFESYVGYWLRKEGVDVKLQDKSHHLAYLEGSGKFQLKPDIVISRGRVIADTKWKLLGEDKTHQGVAQGDMYQLFAYGKKYDGQKSKAEKCEKLVLIYPRQEKNNALKEYDYQFHRLVEESRLNLKILFFDLLNNDNPIDSFWIEKKDVAKDSA